jgi:hypothetical protein
LRAAACFAATLRSGALRAGAFLAAALRAGAFFAAAFRTATFLAAALRAGAFVAARWRAGAFFAVTLRAAAFRAALGAVFFAAAFRTAFLVACFGTNFLAAAVFRTACFAAFFTVVRLRFAGVATLPPDSAESLALKVGVSQLTDVGLQISSNVTVVTLEGDCMFLLTITVLYRCAKSRLTRNWTRSVLSIHIGILDQLTQKSENYGNAATSTSSCHWYRNLQCSAPSSSWARAALERQFCFIS